MSNRPELSDLFLWMAIFINFVLNETPCDFSLLAGCRLCAGAYSGEFRLPVRPGVVATSLLPGMFCAKFFLPMALRAERRRVLAVICVVASTLIIEWMSLLLASFHTTPSENLMRAPFPGLFSNPVFILILLVAIVVPGELLSHYLKKKLSEERYVTFISDRRKVVLPIEAILYVESNDKEVLLHTQEGLTGRGPVFRNGLSGSTIGSSVFIGPI